jgi:hypothetical protein
MATYTPEELQALWTIVNHHTNSQHWVKSQVNAALQAIEDFVELPATRTAIGSRIETAAPGVFDATEKEVLVLAWAFTYATRKGYV